MNELAEPFPVSLQLVSKHLKVLEHAGLITRSRAAQRRTARPPAAPLGEVTDWLEHCRHLWEVSFDRLTDHLREIQKGDDDD